MTADATRRDLTLTQTTTSTKKMILMGGQVIMKATGMSSGLSLTERYWIIGHVITVGFLNLPHTVLVRILSRQISYYRKYREL